MPLKQLPRDLAQSVANWRSNAAYFLVVHLLEQARGYASPDFMGADAGSLRHDRAGGNNGVITDYYIGKDGRIGSDGYVVANSDGVMRKTCTFDDMRDEQRALANDRVMSDLDKKRIVDQSLAIGVRAEVCA